MEPLTHKTRRESNEKTGRETRYKKILAVLEPGIEMTSWEVMRALGYQNPNDVRPRLTELQQKGTLETVPDKKKYEPSTDRWVAVYRRKNDA